MKPSKMTVEELFGASKRYLVPLFQRPYVWDEEGQWAPLWEDIEERASAVQSASRGMVRDHFLGAVVLHQVPTFGRELTAVEIIDGQQRLTTLQVLLAAFRDCAKGRDEDLDYDLKKLTRNKGVMAGPDEQFKVWPTNADRRDYRTVMESGSAEEVERLHPLVRKKYKKTPEPRPRLIEAYLFFSGLIREFCEPDGEFDLERGYALLNALRRHLQLIVIELEGDDNPQVIFETLNARGVSLLPSDLVRNYVFLEAGRRGEDADRLYKELWAPYDERSAESGQPESARFWKVEERQGRFKRPRLDLFLHHFVQSRAADVVAVHDLYDAFREWWRSVPERSVEEELKALQQVADIYARLVVPEGTEPFATFARRMRVAETSTFYPVVLLLLQEGAPLGRADLEGILRDLESFLVRRTVCRQTTKNYNKMFMSLARKVRGADHITRDMVRSFLLEGRGPAAEWPNDSEFKTAWMELPLYQLLRRDRVAMMLDAIEANLRTQKTENIRIDGALTVEHVLPQQWKDADYPLPVGNEDARERRDALVHTMGNLTLLTAPLNTAISNGSFTAKKKAVREHGLLMLNKHFEDLDRWDEDAIVHRGELLFEQARRIWAHPGGES